MAPKRFKIRAHPGPALFKPHPPFLLPPVRVPYPAPAPNCGLCTPPGVTNTPREPKPYPRSRNASGCAVDFCARRGVRRVAYPSWIWQRLTTKSLRKKTRQTLGFYCMVTAKRSLRLKIHVQSVAKFPVSAVNLAPHPDPGASPHLRSKFSFHFRAFCIVRGLNPIFPHFPNPCNPSNPWLKPPRFCLVPHLDPRPYLPKIAVPNPSSSCNTVFTVNPCDPK